MRGARVARLPVLVLTLLVAAGCRTTPDEIRDIQVENELLREQIQIVKENCAYYRALELDVDQKPSDEKKPQD